MAEEGWLSDNEGRINNLSLAPNAKNTLFPLFEAVMNAIQAIEERFGRDNLADGAIEIEILKDERGDYVGFSVTDNLPLREGSSRSHLSIKLLNRRAKLRGSQSMAD